MVCASTPKVLRDSTITRSQFWFAHLVKNDYHRYRSSIYGNMFNSIVLMVRADGSAPHYGDDIMSARVSQITSPTTVCATVYSGADQRKHQSSASLAFVRGIHRWPVNSPHTGQWRGKCFHSMMSSWLVAVPSVGTMMRNFGSRSGTWQACYFSIQCRGPSDDTN